MIVPSMNLFEIRNALIKDYEREIMLKCKNLKLIYKGKWERNGRKDFTETVPYVSTTKNKWYLIVTCKEGRISFNPYVISYDHVGIIALNFLFGFQTHKVMYFNTHFFKRYRERLQLNIEKPEDLVKYFFRKNAVMLPSYYPMEDGTSQLFCWLGNGVGLGKHFQDAKGEIHQFKTFVDNSLLREDQKEQIVQIWQDTLDWLTAEMNEFLDYHKEKRR
jgi:hypothetical protein